MGCQMGFQLRFQMGCQMFLLMTNAAKTFAHHTAVIPAKAGIHAGTPGGHLNHSAACTLRWIPAFAGMTKVADMADMAAIAQK
jgi:hypothetical protein